MAQANELIGIEHRSIGTHCIVKSHLPLLSSNTHHNPTTNSLPSFIPHMNKQMGRKR
eukprot:m.18046 g.18046  ORF g.18046 m.18046 type:complete len:57 (+) comp8236_c0_seq1:145-315(+)